MKKGVRRGCFVMFIIEAQKAGNNEKNLQKVLRQLKEQLFLAIRIQRWGMSLLKAS